LVPLHRSVPLGHSSYLSLAAHRAGIKSEFTRTYTRSEHELILSELIVPAACKSDIDENVPDSVKSGIEFVFVEEVRQVLHEVFKGSKSAERWLETLPAEKKPERVSIP
jgi:hypothetical protein